MEISALLLARVQFALSLNFHVLFAALAMALGWILGFFRWMAWRRPDAAWMAAYRFWVRVFALAFILALASALPVLFELGTLWPALLERVGNVAGPLLAFGITTLFLVKSVFMGVMLFGQRRVSDPAHVFAVFMVALGLSGTVFWGVVLQSWTHTPEGATLIDGRYQVIDWAELILNPALGWYLALFAAGGVLTAGFLMLGITAWQARRRPLEDGERLTFRVGLGVALLGLVIQAVALDGTGRVTARYQPATAAAVAGYLESGSEPDLVWFGGSIKTPQASTDTDVAKKSMSATRWLGRDSQGVLIGMDAVDEGALPPAMAVFWLARLAILSWFVMALVLLVTSGIAAVRGADPGTHPRLVLNVQFWLTFLGAAAWLTVWNLVEIGRTPYLVWGTLTQEDLLTEVGAQALSVGLVATALLYAVLLAGFVGMLFHAARYGVVPVRKPGVRP